MATWFQVEGIGEFPRAMLSYDQCRPAADTDRRIVEAVYGKDNHILFDGRTHRFNRVTLISDLNRGVPTYNRWESFGWCVVMPEDT